MLKKHNLFSRMGFGRPDPLLKMNTAIIPILSKKHFTVYTSIETQWIHAFEQTSHFLNNEIPVFFLGLSKILKENVPFGGDRTYVHKYAGFQEFSPSQYRYIGLFRIIIKHFVPIINKKFVEYVEKHNLFSRIGFGRPDTLLMS